MSPLGLLLHLFDPLVHFGFDTLVHMDKFNEARRLLGLLPDLPTHDG